MTGASLLTACAVVCAAASIFELAQAPVRTRRAMSWGRAAAVLLAGLARRLGLRVPVAADLEARLAAAGVTESVRPGDVMAVKAGGAAVALLLALPLGPSAPGRLALVLLVAAPAAAFLAPDLWLRRRARARALVLASDLPDVLDLLRVSLASSLPLTAALKAVGMRRRGLLAAELAATADRMSLGLDRAAALQRLAERCPLPGIHAFVAAARRSEVHGVSLAPALAAIAADARADRARRQQDRAARAAPKIQLVVALLLVPAAMLLLAAGMLAGFA